MADSAGAVNDGAGAAAANRRRCRWTKRSQRSLLVHDGSPYSSWKGHPNGLWWTPDLHVSRDRIPADSLECRARERRAAGLGNDACDNQNTMIRSGFG